MRGIRVRSAMGQKRRSRLVRRMSAYPPTAAEEQTSLNRLLRAKTGSGLAWLIILCSGRRREIIALFVSDCLKTNTNVIQRAERTERTTMR
jgi:hypothetical protein